MSSRKQTLKSLLGASDERVDVDLNLDQQVFSAPTVRAGNYTVAPPVYARTNALTQLSNALERYSGPLLKQYAGIKEEQSIAMRDATELLSDEELKSFNQGDTSTVLESIKNDKKRFDDLERKQVISFLENPNNYERAYRRVGERAANAFSVDFLSNMQKYAEDPDFNMKAHAAKTAEEFGLTGLGRQEFEKQINSLNARTLADFTSRKNQAEQQKAMGEEINSIATQLGNEETTTTGAEGLQQALGNKTLGQQKTLFTGIVSQLAGEDPARAEKLVSEYRDGTYRLGNNSAPDDAYADGLEEIIQREYDVAQTDLDNHRTLRNQSFQTASLSVANTLERDPSQIKELGPVSIIASDKDGNDIEITVDTTNVKTLHDYGVAGLTALDKIKDEISTEDYRFLENKFISLEAEELKVKEARYTAAGVANIRNQLSESYSTQDTYGNYIYNFGSISDINDQILKDEIELKDKIDTIYADTSKSLEQRKQEADAAVRTFVVDKTAQHQAKLLEDKKVSEQEKFDKAVGSGMERLTLGYQNLLAKYQADNPDIAPDAAEPPIDPLAAREQAKAFAAETDKGAEKIRTRERTDDEKDLSDAAFQRKLVDEAREYVNDRQALATKDVNYDGRLDGILEESQDASALTDEQEKGLKEKNVNVNIGTDSGFTLPNKNRKNKYTQEDRNKISTQRELDNANKIGFGQVKTNHERTLESILEIQSGTVRPNLMYGPATIDVTDNEYYQKKLVEEKAVYLSAEGLKRAIEKGEAPITVDELLSGSINGVEFNASALDQSAYIILPFKLLDNAYRNQLTVQDEAMLRDYADALYDTAQLNEAQRQELIQTMIKLQTAAYSQRGFTITKE